MLTGGVGQLRSFGGRGMERGGNDIELGVPDFERGGLWISTKRKRERGCLVGGGANNGGVNAIRRMKQLWRLHAFGSESGDKTVGRVQRTSSPGRGRGGVLASK